MPTVHEVPAEMLASKLVDNLRRVAQVSPPSWTPYVKTGSHVEHPPQDKDWWYTRCASLLRKVYLHGPIGLNDLEAAYGTAKTSGYPGRHHRDAGGSIVRKALQQLESAGFVRREGTKGRMMTDRGASLLDRLSNEILKELVKEIPALSRYT